MITKYISEAGNLSIALPKGSLIHLVAPGQELTLCGRDHHLNPRHVQYRTIPTEPGPTCKRCIALDAN